jgi:hypothetical protein
MQKAIMRRVYYTYALSVVLHPLFWRGLFLGAAAVLLTRWLHVASILDNFLSIPVGTVPQYITSSVLNAVTHGEVLTVLTLTAASLVGLSCLYQILRSVHIERFFIHSLS